MADYAPLTKEQLEIGKPYFVVHAGNNEITGWREYLGTWKTDTDYLMFRGYEFYAEAIGRHVAIYRYEPKGEKE